MSAGSAGLSSWFPKMNEHELPLNYKRQEAALRPPETFKDQHHARYHEAQRTQDTAAKKLARKAGLKFAMCPCGEEFSV